MQISPELRLGSGAQGTQQGFENLVNHPWFKESVFDMQHKKVPLEFEPMPIYVTKELKKKMSEKF